MIVEGFRSEAYPKIEIHRQANNKPTLFQDDPNIVAIATDAAVSSALPIADLNDIEAIGELVLRRSMRVEDLRDAAQMSRRLLRQTA